MCNRSHRRPYKALEGTLGITAKNDHGWPIYKAIGAVVVFLVLGIPILGYTAASLDKATGHAKAATYTVPHVR